MEFFIIYSDTILIFFGVLTALIPFAFQVKKGGRSNFFKRLTRWGWIFISAMALTVLAAFAKGWIQTKIQVNQKEKDKLVEQRDSLVFNNVDTIKNKADSNLILINKLVDSTSLVVLDIQNAFSELRGIQAQLKKTAKDAKAEIINTMPNIFREGDVVWGKNTANKNSVLLKLRNSGLRRTEDFELHLAVFETNKNLELLPLSKDEKTFHIHDKGISIPGQALRDYAILELDTELDKIPNYVVLLLKYKYKDTITKIKREEGEALLWRGFAKDSITFWGNSEVLDLAQGFAKERKITFNWQN